MSEILRRIIRSIEIRAKAVEESSNGRGVDGAVERAIKQSNAELLAQLADDFTELLKADEGQHTCTKAYSERHYERDKPAAVMVFCVCGASVKIEQTGEWWKYDAPSPPGWNLRISEFFN